MKQGKVWLVGAGPGDVGLFTLKGRQVLAEAEVVVYDSLVGDGLLAMIPREAEAIDVGKRASNHKMLQEDINALLLAKAKAGFRVVRLKGGDPFLFGRGGEELELLSQEGIPYEVVPGITSPIAVPAYNGIPVTHRDFVSSLHIVTGHKRAGQEYDIDFKALVDVKGTLVFLMGISALPDLMKGLLDGGMDPQMPAAVLQQGTTARQKRVVASVATLEEEVIKAGIVTPAIIVVGRVCSLSDSFAWYEKLPLSGARIVVTRPKELISSMAEKLRRQGAEVLELPAISTAALPDMSALDRALNRLEKWQWIAFTSPTGVKVFMNALLVSGRDIRSLAHAKLAVIGSGTAKALGSYGLRADLMPEVFDGASLGKLLAESCGEGEGILLPRAAMGNREILEALEVRKDLRICDIATYDTFYELPGLVDEKKGFLEGSIDCAVFTSASTVRGFARAMGDMDFSKVQAVCIGKQTKAEADSYGMVTSMAEKATIDSLVEKVIELFSK